MWAVDTLKGLTAHIIDKQQSNFFLAKRFFSLLTIEYDKKMILIH